MGAVTQLPLDHQALNNIDRRAHVLVALTVGLQRNVAAYGVKLAFKIIDTPTVEGEHRDLVGTVDLGDLARDCLRVGRRSDRRNATELGPGVIGGVILLAALLQVTGKPTIRFHMERAIAILPDDHQGGEITSGAKVKPGIDAGPYRNLGIA